MIINPEMEVNVESYEQREPSTSRAASRFFPFFRRVSFPPRRSLLSSLFFLPPIKKRRGAHSYLRERFRGLNYRACSPMLEQHERRSKFFFFCWRFVSFAEAITGVLRLFQRTSLFLSLFFFLHSRAAAPLVAANKTIARSMLLFNWGIAGERIDLEISRRIEHLSTHLDYYFVSRNCDRERESG